MSLCITCLIATYQTSGTEQQDIGHPGLGVLFHALLSDCHGPVLQDRSRRLKSSCRYEINNDF